MRDTSNIPPAPAANPVQSSDWSTAEASRLTAGSRGNWEGVVMAAGAIVTRANFILANGNGEPVALPSGGTPMSSMLLVGVADDVSLGVGNEDSSVKQGNRLVEGRLQLGPAFPGGIVTGQQSLQAGGPHLLAPVLKVVHFPLGRVSHVEADAAKGQGQHHCESQHRAELEAGKPLTHRQTCTRRHRRCGCTAPCPGWLRACGAGWKRGHPPCGRSPRNRSQRPAQLSDPW